MYELGCKVLVRGDCPHNNYFASNFDITNFGFASVFGGGGKFDSPVFDSDC